MPDEGRQHVEIEEGAEEATHKETWHYVVPRGRNKGQERCDYFGSDCPFFLHTDHAASDDDPPKGDQK